MRGPVDWRPAAHREFGSDERHGGGDQAEKDLSHPVGSRDTLAMAFPKEHGVQQGEVVESKRLSATMDFIKERQRERTEAKVANPSTTLRKARMRRGQCAAGGGLPGEPGPATG
jgi:hypothetical protein